MLQDGKCFCSLSSSCSVLVCVCVCNIKSAVYTYVLWTDKRGWICSWVDLHSTWNSFTCIGFNGDSYCLEVFPLTSQCSNKSHEETMHSACWNYQLRTRVDAKRRLCALYLYFKACECQCLFWLSPVSSITCCREFLLAVLSCMKPLWSNMVYRTKSANALATFFYRWRNIPANWPLVCLT